jgi:signal transduction histidine kinase
MYLDANLIKQVLVNLLNNAIQAMTPTGAAAARLSISTAVGNVAGQPTLTCRISDTGPGIKAEHLGKIFDPFFTTKEVGQGTGLGLSISYGIIEQHGGTISVTSQPGQGATFTITLPAPAVESGPVNWLPLGASAGATLA